MGYARQMANRWVVVGVEQFLKALSLRPAISLLTASILSVLRQKCIYVIIFYLDKLPKKYYNAAHYIQDKIIGLIINRPG